MCVYFKQQDLQMIGLKLNKEVGPRYRDPQLQVDESYSNLFNFRRNIYKSWMFKHTFRFH